MTDGQNQDPDNAWHELTREQREAIDSYLRHRREKLSLVWSGVVVAVIAAFAGIFGLIYTALNDRAQAIAQSAARGFLESSLATNTLETQANETAKISAKATKIAAQAERTATRVTSLSEKLEKDVLDRIKNAETILARASKIAIALDQVSNSTLGPEQIGSGVNTSPLPAEAVIPIDSVNGCPEGWAEFEPASGRMIVAVGDGKGRLSLKKYRDVGGEETHTLTLAETPIHDHGFQFHVVINQGSGTDKFVQEEGGGNFTGLGNRRSTAAGRGEPHNNMPPYIALYLCKKI